MRKAERLLCALLLAAACGGGGGGRGSSTPEPLRDLFVRASAGSNRNDGLSPGTALRTLSEAVDRLLPGDRVIVGPGHYSENVMDPRSGTAAAPIVFLADTSGEHTFDAPGAVIVEGGSGLAAFRLTRSAFVTIDGFDLRGGTEAAVQLRNRSDHSVIRNCRVGTSQGDGIRIQDSDDILVFNNLVYKNARRGIVVAGTSAGSQRAHLANNTIVDNGDRGVYIGTSSVASRNANLQNNIVAFNQGKNVQIATGPPSSLDGFVARFNLVFPRTYVPDTVLHPTDVNLDPRFVNRQGSDYHLAQRTAGQSETSPAVDAADPETPQEFVPSLQGLSTASTGAPDIGRLDIGYHD